MRIVAELIGVVVLAGLVALGVRKFLEMTTTVTPEAEQMHVSVKSECPRELPEINADPAMLSQAILNLALNGCQAMPNGGSLKLSCHSTSRNRVEVDVEDTGVGLAPANATESALSAILTSGNYTAIVRGAHGTTGVGLVEVYSLR